MSIREIMTPHPVCVPPTASLTEVSRIMGDRDVGMLPVCENDSLVGTVTDRDVVIRGVARGRDPNSTTVREVMTHQLVYGIETQSIDEICHLMEKNQIRRIPILSEQKRLVGIVALADVAVRTHSEIRGGEVLGKISEP